MDVRSLGDAGYGNESIGHEAAGATSPMGALWNRALVVPRWTWAHSGFYRPVGKRFFDIAGAAAMLVAALPLLLLLLAAVAINGGRPLFAHTRIGRRGRPFSCLKVRSMVPDAQSQLAEILRTDRVRAREWERDHKFDDDPRVTRIGAVLRKTSLDELPQIWNVLRGDMSLVGPRPVTAEELDRYGAAAAAYKSVRPGLTGPWQVQGRNDISYEERIALDQAYTRDISFLRDLRIMLMTAFAVVRATGR